ncbi:waprin-Phi2-like [Physella acuta]|uniref:waprin-Phi2-like n=1 Tax=Physella acuta TaxID=109671 RepID=UPI0027DAE16D|nr:waprin-Phi2-like [Physella acuta]XP_059149661.1 waprin-Phi2-like [Physella acuta]XP_059149662.1 waprin-Phi2-like [Physella acuta]XP_059149663.1 waprin-Phi2-like [Physella acuta]
MKATVLLLASVIAVWMFSPDSVQGSYLLTTTCPTVTGAAGADCTSTCTSDSDCDTSSKCCDNGCGGKKCTVVKASCSVGDKTIPHHGMMTYNSRDENDCGFCWCQNGQKECLEQRCNGAIV